jgi:hypothetical protein
LEGWQAGRLASWQVGRLASWQVDRLAGWQAGRLASWQAGKLASWQAGKLASWQVGVNVGIQTIFYIFKARYSIVYFYQSALFHLSSIHNTVSGALTKPLMSTRSCG